jgi:hypothetical protein
MTEEDFGIVTRSGEGDDIKIELSFSDNGSDADLIVNKKKDAESQASGLVSLKPSPVEYAAATRIICNIWPSFDENADLSNHIVNGRDVVITNKIIQRTYVIFNTVMARTKNRDMKDIKMAITYACRIVSEEYIQKWQDQQHLVLLLLRIYVERGDFPNRNELYMKIDSHVPIYVEKLLHPKKQRFKWIRWPRCCTVV